MDRRRSLKRLGRFARWERALKRAQHAAERAAYRKSLPSAGGTTEREDEGNASLKARVLALAQRLGWPRVLGNDGEASWRRDVEGAREELLRTLQNTLNWWARKRREQAPPRAGSAR